MINQIIGQRLKLIIASKRCELCNGEFKDGSIIGGEDFLMLYSDKRYFSLNSKIRSAKPLAKSFSVPLLNRQYKRNHIIFLRNTMAPAASRKLGNVFVALLNCSRCGNEFKIEINADNINNLCSK